MCIRDFFIFFIFFINTSVLCVWFAEFSVFGLLLYWGLISLLATTRRDGILPGTSDVMGSIYDSIYIYIYIYFWVENPWACLERATCNGLAVGLVLLYIYIYIYFFFF